MGGWDYYCAICGGPLSRPYWQNEEEEDNDEMSEDLDPFEPPQPYDPAIISSPEDPQLAWLRQFRVVTEIPKEYNKNAPEGWISGPCSTEMYGDASLSYPLEDAHLFPGHANGWTHNIYNADYDDPWAVPFHDDCHALLLKYIGKDKLDADVFYETCKELAGQNGDNSKLGDLDYGDISDAMEQYWGVYRDAEWMVFSPFDVPQLAELFNNPPQLEEVTGSQAGLRAPKKHDPFSRFPPEIMVNIVSSLDLGSMGNIRLASRIARNVELGNHFWKQKVHKDMPWLFDIPDAVEISSTVDWKCIYGRMLHAARAPSKTVIRGLANRRRIWKQMLPQMGPKYLENLAMRQVDQAGEPEAFVNSRSTSSALLVLPEPKDTKSHTVALLETPHSLETAKVDLAVCFNAKGEVSDIRVTRSENKIITYETEDVYTIEEMTIPDNAWVTGLLVTTRNARPVGIQVLLSEGEAWGFGETGEGGKRLVYVPKDNFVVGFRLHRSKQQELLCRIGLIYHQDWRSGSGSHRIWDYNNYNDESYNVDTMDKLWLNQLPPPKLHATEPQQGYWAHDMHTETSPFEALVLPKHYTELEDLVAIAADVQFGGFELRFATRPTRTIGARRHAMKILEVDGKGGERISTVHICVHHIPTSIRIVTNRGRQLVIGQPDESEKRLPDSWSEEATRPIYGLFGYWQKRDSVQASLDSVGALYLDDFVADPITDVSRQAGGLVWEPVQPPSETVATSGPIFGSLEQEASILAREKNIPEDCNLLSWLDFSRPVSSVRVTTCHSLDINQIPLVGIQLKYADGNQETAAIGPSEFDPPTDTKAPNGEQYWCWCQFAGARVKEELKTVPHYQHHEWEVGNKNISILRVFTALPKSKGAQKAMKGALGAVVTAIQFVADDGATSPVVGYWGRMREGEGEDVKEIEFGTGKNFGVKFFAGSNGRSVTREDHIVQALQALVKRG